MESGQSQFATLKLRSLALVPSSGALSRPYELHLWQLHCETLPAAPRRSGQRLAAVPRPGFAGPGARGIRWKERPAAALAIAHPKTARGYPKDAISPGTTRRALNSSVRHYMIIKVLFLAVLLKH